MAAKKQFEAVNILVYDSFIYYEIVQLVTLC